jgi:alkaline phosphatase
MKTARTWVAAATAVVLAAAAPGSVRLSAGGENSGPHRRARNVIFFVGDGMGVSTITAARVFSVGVAGQLVVDQFPYTALSRTYSADSITPDSAPTMSAMMTGVNTNQSVLSLDETTEPNDFNHDGDGAAPWTLLELAKAHGMRVGVVSTARVTHATPAATYAHINQRDNENAIASQALPTDPAYNTRLGRGLDLLWAAAASSSCPAARVTRRAAWAHEPMVAIFVPSSSRPVTATCGTPRASTR